MYRLYKNGNCLILEGSNDYGKIEPWGKNTLRFRSSPLLKLHEENWNLLNQEETKVEIEILENEAYITNGKIKAKVNSAGVVSYFDKSGKKLLSEVRDDMPYEEGYVPPARTYKPICGDAYKIDVEFNTPVDEKVYGLGQNANGLLDQKGCSIDLIHLNQQTSIPFFVSDNHYGFLWNNPATGRIDVAKNVLRATADVTKQLDYLIIAGDSIAEIVEQYSELTGKSPEMPEYIAGYWQCKLRYWNQNQVLEVAREHKKRNIPLSVIVIDFFHWTKQGEYKFDPKYWPNPKEMIEELHAMGTKVMVSVWPTVDPTSENYYEMLDRNMMLRSERGLPFLMEFDGPQAFIDPTNPETRQFVWEKCKENYLDLGVDMFWLDESEPEIRPSDFDNIRYYIGHGSEVTNLYPFYYSKIFYDGMKEAGIENPVTLTRCAWIGSQRFGNVVWSGDVLSNFKVFKEQVKTGLNIGLCGIPWWTTDIGGFASADPSNPTDRELVIRWFQWATFCPVMRMHGWRSPADDESLDLPGFPSGGPNEVWSYGEEAYNIFVKYIQIREGIKDYILKHMKIASQTGRPVMRPLFYDFEDDKQSFQPDDEYLFGSDILVAPILDEKVTSRTVYLPKGTNWINVWDKKVYNGGTEVTVEADIATIPLFLKEGSEIDLAIFE